MCATTGKYALRARQRRPHPPAEVQFRTGELDPADEIVVYCHQGVRSAAVADYLRGRGFHKVWNLAGGLDRWARRVDPAMRRY